MQVVMSLRGHPSKALLCAGIPALSRTLASSSGSLTDQMITYALQQAKAQQVDQAIDVLRSGVEQSHGKGVEAARLLLVQGTLEADKCRWSSALDCLSDLDKALGSASHQPTTRDTAPPVDPQILRMTAGRLAVTIHLIQGRDDAAQAACQASANSTTPDAKGPTAPLPSAAHQAGTALSLFTSHLLHTGDTLDSIARGLQTAVDSDQGGGAPQQYAHAVGLVTLADFYAAGGGSEDGCYGDGSGARMAAAPLYKRAMDTLDKNPILDSEYSILHKEVGAAAALGSAQLAVHDQEWEQAEEILGKALSMAEEITDPKHPRLVPALVLLGHVYSRTARVTFAEGLYREAAKILQVDPPAQGNPKLPLSVHPSLTATLSWRFHQLLTALPNRGREAEAWKKFAEAAWSQSGPVAKLGPIDAALGSSDVLTGKGSVGAGLLLALQPRRALPLLSV